MTSFDDLKVMVYHQREKERKLLRRVCGIEIQSFHVKSGTVERVFGDEVKCVGTDQTS